MYIGVIESSYIGIVIVACFSEILNPVVIIHRRNQYNYDQIKEQGSNFIKIEVK